jgi:hypothetical protein
LSFVHVDSLYNELKKEERASPTLDSASRRKRLHQNEKTCSGQRAVVRLGGRMLEQVVAWKYEKATFRPELSLSADGNNDCSRPVVVIAENIVELPTL